MNIDLTPIVQAVITLLSLLITTFLIPWIKAKCDAKKLENIAKWVRFAVEAAEQIFKGDDMGESKKQYVVNFLSEKGYKLDLDEINALIESTVFNIKGEEETRSMKMG